MPYLKGRIETADQLPVYTKKAAPPGDIARPVKKYPFFEKSCTKPVNFAILKKRAVKGGKKR